MAGRPRPTSVGSISDEEEIAAYLHNQFGRTFDHTRWVDGADRRRPRLTANDHCHSRGRLTHRLDLSDLLSTKNTEDFDSRDGRRRTITGTNPPVSTPKCWCPTAVKNPEIVPECAVMERKLDGSSAKISLRRRRVRRAC